MPTINGPSNFNDFPALTPIYNFNPHSCGDVIEAIFPGPNVKALVGNSYTGPAISSDVLLPGPPTVVAYATASSTMAVAGQPIMVYSIPQIIQLTYEFSLNFGGYFMNNQPVNRTNFRLIRGVQNEITFYVRDVDRKPVSIGVSETLTINIVDNEVYETTPTTLMTRNLSTINAGSGIYLLTILPSEMDEWPTTNGLQWSITYNRANSTSVLLWTDRAYSPYSTCTVNVGPAPAPASSITYVNADLALLSASPPLSGLYFYSPALVGAASFAYANGMQTFTISMTNFTGTVRIDASLAEAPVDDPDSPDWFQVDIATYTTNTATVVFNEQGNYLWMRVVVITANLPSMAPSDYWGTVDTIVYKN